jgi:hypothetical protein
MYLYRRSHTRLLLAADALADCFVLFAPTNSSVVLDKRRSSRVHFCIWHNESIIRLDHSRTRRIRAFRKLEFSFQLVLQLFDTITQNPFVKGAFLLMDHGEIQFHVGCAEIQRYYKNVV